MSDTGHSARAGSRRLTAVVDVDGTLVDTNYQHARAWYLAFRACGATVPVWRIHRAVGMGGDQLVPTVAGEHFEREHGDEARACWKREADAMLGEVSPLPGARDLLDALRGRGHLVVLTSSGAPDHVDHYLDLLDVRTLADAWTTSEDVERTKPAPDLVRVALDRVGGTTGVVVGDSPWDCVAAQRAGLPAIGLRSGGFSRDELRDAGAAQVYDALPDLVAALDSTPLR